jgi:hypothetical protein
MVTLAGGVCLKPCKIPLEEILFSATKLSPYW